MPRAVHVAESAILPLALAPAYERTLVAPLPALFARRHLALPAVSEVTDQDGEWGSRGPGSSRRLHLSDGGILVETLRTLDAPDRFDYRIEVARGAMKPLVAHVDGAWTFEPVSDAATRVTWSWELLPSSALTAPLVRAIGLMWPAYARTALVSLERLVAIPAS